MVHKERETLEQTIQSRDPLHKEHLQKLQIRMQELRDSTDLERNETVREIDDTQNELEDAQNHISQLESQLSELVNQQRSATDTDGSHKELQELQMRNELDVLTRERDELADLWDNHDCSTSMISRAHSNISDGRPHTTSNTSQ